GGGGSGDGRGRAGDPGPHPRRGNGALAVARPRGRPPPGGGAGAGRELLPHGAGAVSGERTEEPTPRRLARARERGQVPRSRLFSGSLVLAGGSAGAILGLTAACSDLRSWTLALLLRGESVPASLRESLLLVMRASGPVLGGAFGAAALAGLLTAGWSPTTAALIPRLERLDPIAGMKRLLGWRLLGELVRNGLAAAVL